MSEIRSLGLAAQDAVWTAANEDGSVAWEVLRAAGAVAQMHGHASLRAYAEASARRSAAEVAAILRRSAGIIRGDLDGQLTLFGESG